MMWMRAIARESSVLRFGAVALPNGTTCASSAGETCFCIPGSPLAMQIVAPPRATGPKHNHTALFSHPEGHIHAELTFGRIRSPKFSRWLDAPLTSGRE